MFKKNKKNIRSLFNRNIYSILKKIDSKKNKNLKIKTILKINNIIANPFQPRTFFDKQKLNELKNSIKTYGLLTPILVREKKNGFYELIAGERRLKAAKMAGLKFIDVIILSVKKIKMLELAIIENIQRENLNPLDEAMGFKMLIKNLKITQKKLAFKINKSRSYVANSLRLLNLPLNIQNLIKKNKLSASHVRPLITIKDKKKINFFIKKILKENLSVRSIEKKIQNSIIKKNKNNLNKKNYNYNKKKNIILIKKKIKSKKIKIFYNKIIIFFSDYKDLKNSIKNIKL